MTDRPPPYDRNVARWWLARIRATLDGGPDAPMPDDYAQTPPDVDAPHPHLELLPPPRRDIDE